MKQTQPDALSVPGSTRQPKSISVLWHIVSWSAAILGIAGCALLAIDIPISKWAWSMYLASSVLFIVYGLQRREYSVVAVNAGFSLADLIGIWNFLL